MKLIHITQQLFAPESPALMEHMGSKRTIQIALIQINHYNLLFIIKQSSTHFATLVYVRDVARLYQYERYQTKCRLQPSNLDWLSSTYIKPLASSVSIINIMLCVVLTVFFLHFQRKINKLQLLLVTTLQKLQTADGFRITPRNFPTKPSTPANDTPAHSYAIIVSITILMVILIVSTLLYKYFCPKYCNRCCHSNKSRYAIKPYSMVYLFVYSPLTTLKIKLMHIYNPLIDITIDSPSAIPSFDVAGTVFKPIFKIDWKDWTLTAPHTTVQLPREIKLPALSRYFHSKTLCEANHYQIVLKGHNEFKVLSSFSKDYNSPGTSTKTPNNQAEEQPIVSPLDTLFTVLKT